MLVIFVSGATFDIHVYKEKPRNNTSEYISGGKLIEISEVIAVVIEAG